VSVETVRSALANPFPGLRPFRQAEADLFFGRDRQSDELVRRLAGKRFLAVLGTSGSGKSSLVRGGLLPSLEGGLMAEAGTHWLMAILRPQDDPIGFLARALVEAGVLTDRELPGDAAAGVVETTLRRSSLGLVEVARLARLEPHENLLILVDQFEELFRFADLATERGTDDEAKSFVKLLLAAAETDVPVYVVITMRSDFLGDCDRFPGLPEAITDSPYLTPRPTRDELQAAITGPVGVRGGRIAPALVQRLLNDVGDDPDQLPILQHALMRAWDHWQHDDPDTRPIDLSDLEAIGGMAEALSQHAEEAYGSLAGERERTIAERLFKCLTEKGHDNRELRRPTPLSRVAAIASVDPAEVVRVVDVFRAPGRSFLMPPHDVELDADSVIDISHESLIRQWWRLRTWVEEEAESVSRYRRLAESAELHERGAAGLLDDPELSLMLAWRDAEMPNAAWAERYDPAIDRALAFLETSANAHDEEETRLRRAARRKRLVPIVALSALAIVAILVAFSVVALNQRNSAVTARREAVDLRLLAERRQAAITRAVRAQFAVQLQQDKVNNVSRKLAKCLHARRCRNKHALKVRLGNELQRVADLTKNAQIASAAASATSVGGNLISEDSIRSSDPFDVAEGSRETGSSGFGGTTGRAMFGQTGGSPETAGMLDDQVGETWVVTFFADDKPAGYKHWVEWTTKDTVKLKSIGLFARHDEVIDGYRFRRSFKEFRLYAREGKNWVQLVRYSPALPYAGGPGGTSLAVCLPVPSTSAREFRAVFVQAVNVLDQFSAPRVVGLDGNTAQCADQYRAQ
jgi:hypothetical protein